MADKTIIKEVMHSNGVQLSDLPTYIPSIEPTLFSRISELPTFIASGILFIASASLLLICANEIYARDPIPIEEQNEDSSKDKRRYESKHAKKLRRTLPILGRFLSTGYFILFLFFFTSQLVKIGTIHINSNNFIRKMMEAEAIYILEIVVFPFAVLCSAYVAQTFIKAKREETKPKGLTKP